MTKQSATTLSGHPVVQRGSVSFVYIIADSLLHFGVCLRKDSDHKFSLLIGRKGRWDYDVVPRGKMEPRCDLSEVHKCGSGCGNVGSRFTPLARRFWFLWTTNAFAIGLHVYTATDSAKEVRDAARALRSEMVPLFFVDCR